MKLVLKIRELDNPPNVNDITLAVTPEQWQHVQDLRTHDEAVTRIKRKKLDLYTRSSTGKEALLIQLCHARGVDDFVAKYLYKLHHGMLTHPCFAVTWHVDRHGGKKPYTHERRKCTWYKRLRGSTAVSWCDRQREMK